MNPKKRVRDLIDRIDEKIAEQIEPILDHPEFRTLDRAWRSLHYLVAHSGTGDDFRIEFMSVTKKEIREELAEFRGEHWEKNGLVKHLHDMVYGGFGGEPFGLVVFDYDLDYLDGDANLMDDLDRLGETIHAPIFAGGEDCSVQSHLYVTRPPVLSGVGSAHVTACRIGNALARTGWFPERDLVGSFGILKPATLPSLLAACRFAQYLKCVYRDRQGMFPDRKSAEDDLSSWLAGYVADGETSAEHPLAAASVKLEYDLDDERRYRFRLRIRPGHGIEEDDERVVVGRLGF